jgi:hypothetical protein
MSCEATSDTALSFAIGNHPVLAINGGFDRPATLLR